MTKYYYAVLGALIGAFIALLLELYIQHKRNKRCRHELLLLILKRK